MSIDLWFGMFIGLAFFLALVWIVAVFNQWDD